MVYLAGSASAEFFADIGLCPFEAVKVSCQFQQNASGNPKCSPNLDFFWLSTKLAPFWLQVKVQTSPGFAKGLSDGMPKFIQQEGVAG